MRRFAVLCVFLTIMSAATASAGLIYGTVRYGGKPVGEGVTVSITPPSGGDPIVGTTDKNGTYRVSVPKEGRCTLAVTYNTSTSDSIHIYSYRNPVRCNLVLEDVRGELKLRRE